MPLSGDVASRGEPAGNRASILIVDDLPEKLLVFRTLLEDEGHELVCASSGSEALKEILKREFAVVLLDVNMPDIDGFETARLIRQYKRARHTPIIFITSYADEMQTVRGYSLGAVDYILSPVIPDVLRSKVKVFVDLHLAQRRLRRHADERVALASAQAARSAAEENTRRSNFLSDASRVLGASLDVGVAARQLLEILVPRFAAKAEVALFDERGDVGLVIAGEALAGGVHVVPLGPADSPLFDARALREAIAFGSAATRNLADAAAEKRTVPLTTANGSLGALIVQASSTPADWASIYDLAERAAVALENAKLYRSVQAEIEERRGVEAKLQESNRRKDEFLAMLSHELRNPLAPIRTALEVVRRVAPVDAKLAWATDVMGRQIGQLTRLIEDLLDVARISQGKIPLQLETLDLRSVLAHAVETVRPFIESRQHRLLKNVPETPVWLRGDAARLSQVVANLLNNAAKYTDDGGSIELALVVAADGQAVVSVRDNGVGIEPELLPNVFDLFEQGKRSLDRSEGGLGVGLTLVHRLVQLHHGTVEAASPGAGRGSEFRVRLACLSQAAGDEAVEQAPSVAAASPGCRVLVVDDNADSADAFAALLALGGHAVKALYDGAEALASASVFAPDVVILDIGLPKMDGYEVARRLRNMPQTRSSLLVALTGYGQGNDRRLASEAGFDHHLTKPAEPDELLRLMDDWLRRRGDMSPTSPRALASSHSTQA